MSVAGRPDIFPINYVTTERTIFLRSAEGSKLVSIAINQAVAFEIDGYDEGHQRAWSVVLHGQARLIGHDAMEVVAKPCPVPMEHLAQAPIHPDRSPVMSRGADSSPQDVASDPVEPIDDLDSGVSLPELTEQVDLCLPNGRINPAAIGYSRRPLHRTNLRGWGSQQALGVLGR